MENPVLIFWCLLLLVLHPFAVLLWKLAELPGTNVFSQPGLLESLWFTLAQAALSAGASLFIGLLAAPQYAAFVQKARYQRGKTRRWLGFARALLYLPNLMSPVLVVTCLLTAIPHFPFGWVGIVLGHVFFNSGIAVLWLGQSWYEAASEHQSVALQMGASSSVILRRVLLPRMRPQILAAFWTIFVLCLSSFYIPLVLGGSPRFYTLEAMIYDRVRTDADLKGALAFAALHAVLQALTLGLGALFFRQTKLGTRKQSSRAFETRMRVPFLGLVVAATLWPLVSLVQTALSAKETIPIAPLAHALGFSLSLAAGVFVAILFLLCLLVFQRQTGRRLLLLPSISGVFAGFAALMLFYPGVSESRTVLWLAIVLAQVTVFLGTMVRLSWPRIEQVSRLYFPMAFQTGASQLQVFYKIGLPLVAKTTIAASMLAFCWALGDVGVVSLLAPADSTITLLIHGLQGSYRLEQAAVVSLLLLLVGFVALFFLGDLNSGFDRES